MSTRKDRDYSKSIIYKICCNDLKVKDVYVGSTTNFKERKHHHKTSCCNEKSKKNHYKVYQFIRANGGWSNFDMILLEQYDAKTKLELLARERYWYEELKATLNTCVPARTDSEYYVCNKELINEKANEKITCICGSIISRTNKSKHEKTKFHSAYINSNNNVVVEKCVEQNPIE